MCFLLRSSHDKHLIVNLIIIVCWFGLILYVTIYSSPALIFYLKNKSILTIAVRGWEVKSKCSMSIILELDVLWKQDEHWQLSLSHRWGKQSSSLLFSLNTRSSPTVSTVHINLLSTFKFARKTFKVNITELWTFKLLK